MNGILGSPDGMGTLSGRLRVERYGSRALGASALDTAEVKKLQVNLNRWLATHGFQALTVDGALGARTCGATRPFGMPAPVGCTTFTAPTPGRYPWNVTSADTRAMQAVLVETYPDLTVDGVLGPLTCGAAKAMSQYGVFVPSTCQSFTMPAGAKATAPATPSAAAPVDWAALAQYYAAVKAQNDARAAHLLDSVTQARTAKDAADMVAYATAVKAQNDKNAADMIAYATAVKAAQSAGRTVPKRIVPAMRAVPKPKAVVAAKIAPPPPPPKLPAGVPAELTSPPSVEEAGMSGTTKLALGVGAAAIVGYMMFFRKKTAVKAVAA